MKKRVVVGLLASLVIVPGCGSSGSQSDSSIIQSQAVQIKAANKALAMSYSTMTSVQKGDSLKSIRASIVLARSQLQVARQIWKRQPSAFEQIDNRAMRRLTLEGNVQYQRLGNAMNQLLIDLGNDRANIDPKLIATLNDVDKKTAFLVSTKHLRDIGLGPGETKLLQKSYAATPNPLSH